jgi:hypothetical protein
MTNMWYCSQQLSISHAGCQKNDGVKSALKQTDMQHWLGGLVASL